MLAMQQYGITAKASKATWYVFCKNIKI